MTDNNNRHARKVSVSRASRGSTADSAAGSHRRAVAVRRKGEGSAPHGIQTVTERPADMLTPTAAEESASETPAKTAMITSDEASEPELSAETAVPVCESDTGNTENVVEPENHVTPVSEESLPTEDAAQPKSDTPPVSEEPQPTEDNAQPADDADTAEPDSDTLPVSEEPQPTEDTAEPTDGADTAEPESDTPPVSEEPQPTEDTAEPTDGADTAEPESDTPPVSEEPQPTEDNAQPADDADTAEPESDTPPVSEEPQPTEDTAEPTDDADAAEPDSDAPPDDQAVQYELTDDPEAFFDLCAEDTAPPAPQKWYTPQKWYIPQRWKDINFPRKIIMILSAALFLFSCLPLFVGVISPGILPPVMIAAFFFLCALYWPLIDGCESTWGNVLIAVVAVCVLAGVTYLSFVSGKMISASTNTLPEDRSDVTVVVLGCRIHGDRPSRMLHARLEAAADFLLEHPQSHCIVTGGQGDDEDYPEALVMKNWLVDKGISPMRIVMETQSTSTRENITFAAEMAEKYNCHERFLIVTDRFHQYRAMSTANELGIVSYALNVETAWYLAMPYWFREMAAITRDWITA